MTRPDDNKNMQKTDQAAVVYENETQKECQKRCQIDCVETEAFLAVPFTVTLFCEVPGANPTLSAYFDYTAAESQARPTAQRESHASMLISFKSSIPDQLRRKGAGKLSKYLNGGMVQLSMFGIRRPQPLIG